MGRGYNASFIDLDGPIRLYQEFVEGIIPGTQAMMDLYQGWIEVIHRGYTKARMDLCQGLVEGIIFGIPKIG